MKIGVIVPQGWHQRVRRTRAAGRLAALGRRRAAGRAARVRVDLAVRPLPHDPAPDGRDHLRVVHGPIRTRRADEPRPDRPHRHLHGVPQPGPHRQDDLDHGRHQRRAHGAGHRRRLEARRVAGVRLRLPGDAERLARLADDLEVITRMLAGDRHEHATYEGAYGRSGTRSTSPSPSSSHGCRSWSAATART